MWAEVVQAPNLAVELLLIVFQALSFWTRRLGFEVASVKSHISHERACMYDLSFPDEHLSIRELLDVSR